MLSHARLLATPWAVARQAPVSMGNSRGKNTGVGCHVLLQGIFQIQGLNPGLPHCRRILLQSEPPGKPLAILGSIIGVKGVTFFSLLEYTCVHNVVLVSAIC